MQKYTLENALTLFEEFDALLKQNGIKLNCNSELERLHLNALEIYEYHRKKMLFNGKIDIRTMFRDFVGFQDFCSKIIKGSKSSEFSKLIPHLKKLYPLNPLQNLKTDSINQDNNKLFELYIAILFLSLEIDEISLDDPDSSKGNNPDIIVDYKQTKWGFACKALHSLQPQTILDNLTKAIKQIELSSSRIGIPVFNLKNMLNHENYWRILGEDDETYIFSAFCDIGTPRQMLIDESAAIGRNFMEKVGYEHLNSLFKNKKALPYCLTYCPTVSSIVHLDKPFPVRLHLFNIWEFDPINSPLKNNPVIHELLEILNHQLQLIS